MSWASSLLGVSSNRCKVFASKGRLEVRVWVSPLMSTDRPHGLLLCRGRIFNIMTDSFPSPPLTFTVSTIVTLGERRIVSDCRFVCHLFVHLSHTQSLCPSLPRYQAYNPLTYYRIWEGTHSFPPYVLPSDLPSLCRTRRPYSGHKFMRLARIICSFIPL